MAFFIIFYHYFCDITHLMQLFIYDQTDLCANVSTNGWLFRPGLFMRTGLMITLSPI